MFRFLIKKELVSLLLLVLTIITSVFLISEFRGYYKYLPLESEEDLLELSKIGASNDFISRLVSYSDDEQSTIIYNYYQEILKADKTLDSKEIDIIEKSLMLSENQEDLIERCNEIFDYTYGSDKMQKHSLYLQNLIDFAGKDYEDAVNRINHSLENNRISYYFALRFADRMLLIWELLLFAYIAYRYYFYNNNKVKEFTYPTRKNSAIYILSNILVEFIFLALVMLLQIAVFALIMNSSWANIYAVSLYDYAYAYVVFVLPSLLIMIGIASFLCYLFDSILVAFPVYYLVTSFSSRTDISGYVINRTNTILRYDTLFENFTAAQTRIILENRIIMLSLFIVLLISTIYIYYLRRYGKYKFTLKLKRKKNEERI